MVLFLLGVWVSHPKLFANKGHPNRKVRVAFFALMEVKNILKEIKERLKRKEGKKLFFYFF